jgi:hypothetical protein
LNRVTFAAYFLAGFDTAISVFISRVVLSKWLLCPVYINQDCHSSAKRFRMSDGELWNYKAAVVTGLAGLQHQELECEYIGESKTIELRG